MKEHEHAGHVASFARSPYDTDPEWMRDDDADAIVRFRLARFYYRASTHPDRMMIRFLSSEAMHIGKTLLECVGWIEDSNDLRSGFDVYFVRSE